MTDYSLLEKIQKILNMAKGNSNPNEAAVAFRMAQELMEKHGVTEKHLERAKIDTVLVKSTQAISRPKDWEVNLMVTIANAFGCRVLWKPGCSNRKDYWGRFEFVGEKGTLPVVEYTATFMLRNLVTARTKFSNELSSAYEISGREKTMHLDGFCHGWIDVVRGKILAFKHSDELSTIINDFVKERVVGDAKNHSRGASIYGMASGKIAAADVEIFRPMDQHEVKKLSQ